METVCFTPQDVETQKETTCCKKIGEYYGKNEKRKRNTYCRKSLLESILEPLGICFTYNTFLYTVYCQAVEPLPHSFHPLFGNDTKFVAMCLAYRHEEGKKQHETGKRGCKKTPKLKIQQKYSPQKQVTFPAFCGEFTIF